MKELDLVFVNDSEPDLDAENLNAMVGKTNDIVKNYNNLENNVSDLNDRQLEDSDIISEIYEQFPFKTRTGFRMELNDCAEGKAEVTWDDPNIYIIKTSVLRQINDTTRGWIPIDSINVTEGMNKAYLKTADETTQIEAFNVETGLGDCVVTVTYPCTNMGAQLISNLEEKAGNTQIVRLWAQDNFTTGTITLSQSIKNFDAIQVRAYYQINDGSRRQKCETLLLRDNYNIGDEYVIKGYSTRCAMFEIINFETLNVGYREDLYIYEVVGINFGSGFGGFGIDTKNVIQEEYKFLSAGEYKYTAKEDCWIDVHTFSNQGKESIGYIDNVKIYNNYAYSSFTTQEQLIQLSKGQTFKISVTFDNGVYFGAYTVYGIKSNSSSSKHTYSTNEQVVGTWIDGKPIYEKLTEVDYGVKMNELQDFRLKGFYANTYDMILDAKFIKTGNITLPICTFNIIGDDILHGATFTNITIGDKDKTYIYLKYTKTTD